MKNKNGQVAVAFIILIPFLLLGVGSLIEYSSIRYNKTHLESIIKTTIRENIDNPDENKIEELLLDNGIKEDYEIIIEDGIEIKLQKDIDSFLGKLINKDKYELNIDIKGYLDNDKIIYKKGS